MNSKTFKEIKYSLTEHYAKNGDFNCKIMSAIFASYLLSFQQKCYIIDSKQHSVVYDGNNTWDLSNGIVFRNYMYPSLNIPNPEIIPEFEDWFRQLEVYKFYNKECLELVKDSCIIKEVKLIGKINGTEKT